ncbi:MAG: hypothetical protein ABSF52_19920 [Syntrophobacteraceae bacterium]|jgi:hypothetical protein
MDEAYNKTPRALWSGGFTNIVLKPIWEPGSLEMTARLLSLEGLPLALRELITGKAEDGPDQG